MALMGPADAEAFRDYEKGVGRVYVDPLDGCEIAPKTDDWWPSVSAVKKADKSDWSNILVKRLAKLPASEWHRIAELGQEERKRAIWAANDHDLSIASGRGTIVHWWAEDLLNGRPMRKVTTFDLDLQERPIPHEALEMAKLYRPALEDFFRVYEPERVAAEYVGIHRTLNGAGYGCTGDGIIRFHKTKPGVYVSDWKTRDLTSEMKAWPNEGAQIAASAESEYMIVDDGNGGAKRALVPEVDGGVIISIKPEAARVYPIDLKKAFVRFQRIHWWWMWSKEERDAIGRVWPMKRASDKPREEHLSVAILTAPDGDALARLWREYRELWTPEHTELAKRRKAELAGK